MNRGYREREQAAKLKGQRYKVDPLVREQRAAIQDARDAALAQDRAAVEAKQESRPDAIRAVLGHASLDELHELSRTVGQLDGRRMAEIVADVIRQRQRTGFVPASQQPQEAPRTAKASSARRT